MIGAIALLLVWTVGMHRASFVVVRNLLGMIFLMCAVVRGLLLPSRPTIGWMNVRQFMQVSIMFVGRTSTGACLLFSEVNLQCDLLPIAMMVLLRLFTLLVILWTSLFLFMMTTRLVWTRRLATVCCISVVLSGMTFSGQMAVLLVCVVVASRVAVELQCRRGWASGRLGVMSEVLIASMIMCGCGCISIPLSFILVSIVIDCGASILLVCSSGALLDSLELVCCRPRHSCILAFMRMQPLLFV